MLGLQLQEFPSFKNSGSEFGTCSAFTSDMWLWYMKYMQYRPSLNYDHSLSYCSKFWWCWIRTSTPWSCDCDSGIWQPAHIYMITICDLPCWLRQANSVAKPDSFNDHAIHLTTSATRLTTKPGCKIGRDSLNQPSCLAREILFLIVGHKSRTCLQRIQAWGGRVGLWVILHHSVWKFESGFPVRWLCQ